MIRGTALLCVALAAAPLPSADAIAAPHAERTRALRKKRLRAARMAPRRAAADAMSSRRHLLVNLAEAARALASRPQAARPRSFFEEHEARVMYDLLIFQAPPNFSRTALTFGELLGPGTQTVEAARERDRLLLFRDGRASGPGIATATLLFTGVTIASAHAPRRLRFLFDRRLHLGPAVFLGGGVGMGAGTRW